MRSTTIAAVVAFVLIGPLPSLAAQDHVLSTLRKTHPRLLVLDDDIARVKGLIESDPIARRYFERLKSAADKVVEQPVSQRVLIGPRLLGVSRDVLGRVKLLGGLYRLTGERRYAERARDEMLAAAAFEDWNPSHFLDVAEMTNALGIGYDWVYDALTPAERATIKTAIVEKGLKPGLAQYARPSGFHTRTHNWNQVCNGGLTVGALAIADEEPEIARQIIESARASMPRAMASFADGGCDEGPSYWSYATRYIVYYIASLRTALGSDLGFLQSPGLADTGLFRIHIVSPTGLQFNFADGSSNPGTSWQMFWFAQAYDRPVYAAHERLIAVERDRASPLHLLFFNPAGTMADIEQLPTAAMFRRLNVAMMRSAWNDPNAAFVGFKAGDTKANHSHADLGSFVYDVDGVRWALDLGGDDYNLPGYWGANRYTYYRLSTGGHNTLTINNENQDPKAEAPIVAFSPRHEETSFAVADLSAAYAPHASRVQRGVKLRGRQVVVQDEVQAAEPVEVVWNFLTEGKIDISGRVATLSRGDKRIALTIVEPPTARFDTVSANPPPPQAQQPSVTNLVIRQADRVKSLRLVVLIGPAEGATRVGTEPPAKWVEAAPVKE